MDDERLTPGAARVGRDRDVDWALWEMANAPEGGGVDVAQDGAAAAGEDGREPAALGPEQSRRDDGVHAAMEAKQGAGTKPRRQGARGEPSGTGIDEGEDAVRPARKPADRQVGPGDGAFFCHVHKKSPRRPGSPPGFLSLMFGP